MILKNPKAAEIKQADQMDQALGWIFDNLKDGLRHGFYECKISVIVGKGNKRELTVACGKSQRFYISLEELT